ncbi:MAG: hypothetical protein U9Q40_01260 [Campylobacterota bacterium]|nr:hypothetical protein [Campylobacterota bacterium]
MKLLLLLFLSLTLFAQDEYSLRFAYGNASSKDLGDILIVDSEEHPDNLTVLSLDAGYLLVEDMFEFPFDLYLKGGVSYFNEGNAPTREHIYEGTLYLKVYGKLDFLDNRVRVGFGEGVSYTTDILWSEYKEAISEDDEYSRFLNYLDISVDVDLGKLLKYKPLEETYIGWTLKHRSGVAGLYSGVYGGSNYNTISIEKNF